MKRQRKRGPRVKNHTKVTITYSFLRKQLDACETGAEHYKRILPLTISTNPEENVKAAETLVGLNSHIDHGAVWLAKAAYLFRERNVYASAWRVIDGVPNTLTSTDVYLTMQRLAHAADFIATRLGR